MVRPLLAALLFAGSAVLQQHAVTEAVAQPAPAQRRRALPLPVARLLGRLAHDRLWLAGTLANVCGSLVQALALHAGSVGVVQMLLTTQLIFALSLGSVWRRRWPVRRDWAAAAAVCAGLAVFLAVPGVAPPAGVPHRIRTAAATALALVAATTLVLLARRKRRLVHTWLVAVAAGICFAVSAVLMKLTVADLVQRGVPATARDWPGYCLALTNAAGFLAEQEAFAGGSLATTLAIMMITNPIASYLLSEIAFQVHFPHTGPALAALAAAILMISTGVFGLAHSASVHGSTPPSPAPRRRTGAG